MTRLRIAGERRGVRGIVNSTSLRNLSSEAQPCVCRQLRLGKLSGQEPRVGRCCDHGRIVGGELARREVHRQSVFLSAPLKRRPQLRVRRYSAGHQYGCGVVLFCGRQRLTSKIIHYSSLKRRHQVKGLRIAGCQHIPRCRHSHPAQEGFPSRNALAQVVRFRITQNRSLDAAVGKIHALFAFWIPVLRITVAMFDPRERKLHCLRIPMPRQEVDDRPAGIAKFQQLGHLVEGLAGSVVAGVSHIVVCPASSLSFGQKQVRVSTAHHQS